MGLHEIVGVGIALGIDCLAVSAGISTTRPPARVILATCLLFGLFQAGLALAGMAGGAGLTHIVQSPLRFAPPAILCGVGLMMVFSRQDGGGRRSRSPGVVALVGAAVSVSLDALGAGVAMGIADAVSPAAALMIGVISTAMSAAGFAGGALLASRTALAERIGGLILIGLAAIMLIAGIRA
ncbi:MAG: manganese efflux pump [bacterium]